MQELGAGLQRPHARYRDSFIAGVREYIREEQSISWHPEILAARFDEYLLTILQLETEPLAGMVPASRFWLVGRDGRYLGDVDIRHHLTDSLRRFGGAYRLSDPPIGTVSRVWQAHLSAGHRAGAAAADRRYLDHLR